MLDQPNEIKENEMSMLLPLIFLLILILINERKFRKMQPEKITLSEAINHEKQRKQNWYNENAKIEEYRRFIENEIKEK